MDVPVNCLLLNAFKIAVHMGLTFFTQVWLCTLRGAGIFTHTFRTAMSEKKMNKIHKNNKKQKNIKIICVNIGSAVLGKVFFSKWRLL